MKKNLKLTGKGQASRLGKQHELAGGPLGIFGEQAQQHDVNIGEVSEIIFKRLRKTYPKYEFRLRSSLSKKEINKTLSNIDKRLGEVLYVKNASIRPDGGIIEIKDRSMHWRVILVGESKHQGNDVEKIEAGIKQGKLKDQDFMAAGNAIERVHKNISEFRNYMLNENYFPYVVFLQGSNFATKTIIVNSPDGRKVKLTHNAGDLNRIDRVTASNYGMKINKNYCRNITITKKGEEQMLQIPSLFFQCNLWGLKPMAEVMWNIALTSIEILEGEL